MLKVMIGYPYFVGNRKKLFDITEYIESDIIISENRDNKVSSLESIEVTLPVADQGDGFLDQLGTELMEFVTNIRSFDFCPVLVFEDDILLFNGLVEQWTIAPHQGQGLNPKVVTYSTTVVHKSIELESIYTSKTIGMEQIRIDEYVKYILENNYKITKFQGEEEYQDVENDPESLNMKKSLFQNFQLIKIGDVIHRTVNGEILDKAIITEIENMVIEGDKEDDIERMEIRNYTSINNNNEPFILEITEMYQDFVTTTLKTQSGTLLAQSVAENWQSELNLTPMTSHNISCKVLLKKKITAQLSVNPYQVNFKVKRLVEGSPTDPQPTDKVSTRIGYDIKNIGASETEDNIPYVYNPTIPLDQTYKVILDMIEKYFISLFMTNSCEVELTYDANDPTNKGTMKEYIGLDTSDIIDGGFFDDTGVRMRIDGGSVLDTTVGRIFDGGYLDDYADVGEDDVYEYIQRIDATVSDESIFSNVQFTSDCNNIISSLYTTGYVDYERVEYLEPLYVENAQVNTYHQIGDNLENANTTVNPDDYNQEYVMLGNGEISEIENGITINAEDDEIFINKLVPTTFRKSLNADQSVYVSFFSGTTRIFQTLLDHQFIKDNGMDIKAGFLNMKKGKDNYFKLNLVEESNADYTYLNSRLVRFAEVPTGAQVGDRVLVNPTSALEEGYISSIGSGTIDITLYEDVSNFGTASSEKLYLYTAGKAGEFVELDTTQMVKPQDKTYLRINEGVKDKTRTVKFSLQNQVAYVGQYLNLTSGDGFNNVHDLAYARINENDSFDITLVDKNNSTIAVDAWITDHPNFMKPYLDYDLVYIQVRNQSTNKWETYKVKSNTGHIITLYEEVGLRDGTYGMNGVVEFRRLFISTSASMSAKPTDDSVYEAYVVEDRNAFGFNYEIDVDAVAFTGGDTTKWRGALYEKGTVLFVEYLKKNVITRYATNNDALTKYGYIEEIYSIETESNDDYKIYTSNQLKLRAKSLYTGTMDIKKKYYDLKNYRPLESIRYFTIVSTMFENGSKDFIIKSKKWIYKNNIDFREMLVCQVTLEELFEGTI